MNFQYFFPALFFLSLNLYSQEKQLMIFDLETGNLDSLKDLNYDTSIVFDKTDFFIGTYNNDVIQLQQTPPTVNTFPGAQFTYKKQASLDFELSSYPIRTSIKLFEIKNDSLKNNCSGIMISNRHLLTASHCAVDFDIDTLKVDSLIACPIYDNGFFNPNFECSNAIRITAFKDRWLYMDDIAIIELEKPIGEKTGWVSIGFDNRDSVLLEKVYHKFSYPAKSLFSLDSNEYNGDTLYYSFGKISVVKENTFSEPNVTSIPGESGSPMVWVENNSNYINFGVLTGGIHVHNRITDKTFPYLKEFISNDLTVGSLEEKNKYGLFLYPNPTDGLFFIKGFNIEEIDKVLIIDTWGRKIMTLKNPEISPKINLINRPAGLYHVGVKIKDHIYWEKVILNKG